MLQNNFILLLIVTISCTASHGEFEQNHEPHNQRHLSRDPDYQSDQADQDHVFNGHRIADEAVGVPEEYRNARQPNRRRPPKQNENEVNPDVYLEKFGYLSTPKVGESHDAAARRGAIREFQRMAGIEETGDMDRDTAYWMGQPRCGMPDRMPQDTEIGRSRGRSRSNDAPDEYYVPGYKWSHTDLTYGVSRYSVDLSQDSQRTAFYNAFEYWSDVTPLTFSEVRPQDADIEILFGAYEHGDGYGSQFDGEGGTLAHAYYPDNGDSHFDESETWTEYTDRGTNLEIVAAHEFGHALGLGHSSVDGALMKPFYAGYTPNFELGTDDIQAIQSLYGPRERPPMPTPAPGEPTTPRPPSRPDSCTTKFDAVYQGSDGITYAFKHKWVWKMHYWGMYDGFPVLARELFESPPASIGAAAYSFRSGYTYLFKGVYVYQYSGMRKIKKQRIDVEYYEPPHAAFMAEDGRIYLLRGRHYWRFNESTLSVDTGLKRRISDRFPGAPSNIEAAVRLNDGYLYFFKGARYHKYDEYYSQVVSGYPKDKAGPWMGPSCTSDGSYQRK